ncbi:MAG: sensor histidine kinase, partial [Flavisolibacter sp.]
KRQISLHDEIETCRLYLHLEAMRLNGKLKYRFDIDPDLDLKSTKVPALIVQPFIENAVWHGIVPKETGNILIKAYGNNETIICEVEDDGIGRERSEQSRSAAPEIHESKGIHLTQARLNLEKALNNKNATVQIDDKYENNISSGTRVIIEFIIQ